MTATVTPERGDAALVGSSVSSVAKALTLLEAMAESGSADVGVCDLATATSLPKSTAHRLLKELEEHGFVERSGLKYRVGSRFFELSAAARWSEVGELRDIAIPTLEWLFDETGATVSLAVLDGSDVLYVEKITGLGGCRIPTHAGSRLPATCTAPGKAMLAFSPADARASVLSVPLPRLTPYSIRVPRLLVEQFDDIRRRGVAFEHEEARLGVVCVAAPVVVGDRPLAAVSVAGRVPRFAVDTKAPFVLQAAERIARDLTPVW